MDHFTYEGGELHCEAVPAAAVADAAGTPCYVYSKATLVGHYRRLADAFAGLDPLICYSVKSCPNLAVVRALVGCGAGLDLVSGGELHRARIAGADLGRCVYAGAGKTDGEIREAIEAGVGWLNVESEQEFETAAAVAAAMGRRFRAALRVNPDVDPRTHRYTTTGLKATKFGVDLERARAFFERYGRDPHAELCGLHVHLGSSIDSARPYVRGAQRALELIDDLDRRGFAVTMLDLGGGFGADYETAQAPPASAYAAELVPLLEPRVKAGLRLVLEPGRTITANAGLLLLRVVDVKSSGEKTFIICDGGMNVLLRPSHYGSFHFVWPCRVDARHVPPRRGRELDLPGLETVDVVGPICETGDFVAEGRRLPPVSRGDVLAVFAAGAYGMAMASRYNSHPLPAEVMVEGSAAALIRRRERYEDLTAHEEQPQPLPVMPAAGARAG